MEETYELPLDNLLNELEERGIDTSKLNLIEEEDWLHYDINKTHGQIH